jgi:hypothetical protein
LHYFPGSGFALYLKISAPVISICRSEVGIMKCNICLLEAMILAVNFCTEMLVLAG